MTKLDPNASHATWRELWNSFKRWSSDHSFRIGSALTLVVGTSFAILLYSQFHLMSDVADSSRVVLTQLSEQAIDRIALGVTAALAAPRGGLRVMPPEALEPFRPDDVRRRFDQMFDSDREQVASHFFVWTDDEKDDLVWAYDRDTRTLARGTSESVRLMERIRSIGTVSATSFSFPINGRPSYIQVDLRFHDSVPVKLRSWFAVAVDAEHVRTQILPPLVSRLASQTVAPRGFPSLTVMLLDQSNHVIVPTGGSPETPYVHEREVPLFFLGRNAFLSGRGVPYERLRLRIGFGDRSVAEIVAQRQRPQRVTLLMLAGAMAVGVFFVVRRAVQELRLAELTSDFVLSVSHDLKTPLAIIRAHAETLQLKRVATPERQDHYYRVINDEALKLTRLINNIVDFSRGQAKLRSYCLEENDLALVTQDVLTSFTHQLEQHRFQLTSNFAAELPAVKIDEQAVAQALENLLTNAIRYSPDRRHITVDVDSADAYVRVSVLDRGIGIAPELHHKIFQKFYRVRDRTDRGAHGCGLGLAIVQHVMRAHAGFITVESAIGTGSKFTLHFPTLNGGQFEQADSRNRRRAGNEAHSA